MQSHHSPPPPPPPLILCEETQKRRMELQSSETFVIYLYPPTLSKPSFYNSFSRMWVNVVLASGTRPRRSTSEDVILRLTAAVDRIHGAGIPNKHTDGRPSPSHDQNPTFGCREGEYLVWGAGGWDTTCGVMMTVASTVGWARVSAGLLFEQEHGDDRTVEAS